MIKSIDLKELENRYANIDKLDELAVRRTKFDLGLMDKEKVDAEFLYILNDLEKYVGEGVIVFSDARTETEFEYEKALLARPNSALIKNVYILNEFRGQGYFREFMQYITNLAKNKNIAELCLVVDIKNDIAKKVYEHYGFKTDGAVRKFGDIKGVDFIYMFKQL